MNDLTNTDFCQVLNFLDGVINLPHLYGVNSSQLPVLIEIVAGIKRLR